MTQTELLITITQSMLTSVSVITRAKPVRNAVYLVYNSCIHKTSLLAAKGAALEATIALLNQSKVTTM